MEDNSRITWRSLSVYTKQLKDWILQLFRRAHARMGHIEEEVNELKRASKSVYSLNETASDGGKITYTLIEEISGEHRGSIIVDPNGVSIVATWEEDGNGWHE